MKRWTLVFVGDKYCTRAVLRDPTTIEHAREIGARDPMCECGYLEFKGILGVDIGMGELREMGYQIT